MPCILALIVFGILGIFSAAHRALAREAFACVFRRITLRPCNTGFQEKIKGRILARLINRSVFWTRVVNKNYELLSWIFFVLMMGSLGWVLVGGYNFYVYGSCNGLNQSGFCAFDPSGENNKVSQLNDLFCGISPEDQKILTLANVNMSDFPVKNIGAQDDFLFIGCYACDYTRKSYPVIKKLLEKKEVNYTFAHYPTHNDQSLLGEVSYCVAKNYEDSFWSFNDYLFTAEKDFVLDKNNLPLILAKFNFDFEKINTCANSPETKEAIQNQITELNKTGIYGTPTIFINQKAFVGPKPLRVYKSALNKFIFF